MEQVEIRTVAIYLRKSRGDESNDDLAKHRDLLVTMAKNSGWKYTIYEEIASGATIDYRPKMQELLKAHRARHV
jgi:site-specific DNA recombinase